MSRSRLPCKRSSPIGSTANVTPAHRRLPPIGTPGGCCLALARNASANPPRRWASRTSTYRCLRVSGLSREQSHKRRSHPQRSSRSYPFALSLRGIASSRARGHYCSRAGDPAQALRAGNHRLPHGDRGSSAACGTFPHIVDRSARSPAASRRRADWTTRLRVHRPAPQRRPPRCRRTPALSRQGAQGSHHSNDAPTVEVLRGWLAESETVASAPVFSTRIGEPLSRDAIERRIALHAASAAMRCPSLAKKNVTAHVLRHTAAMRLLEAGIDPTVIALWLGHERVETTAIYLHADLGIKEAALARAQMPNAKPGRYRPSDSLLPLPGVTLIMPSPSARSPP